MQVPYALCFLTLLVAAPAGAQTLITPTSLTNTSGVSEFFPAINIVNNTGLSSIPALADYQTVTHAGAGGGNAWTTENPNGAGDYFLLGSEGTPAVFTFTLDATYDLTDLVLWGYHFGGAANGNEAREFSISFSTDGGMTYPASTVASQPLGTYAAANAATLSLGGTFQANTIQIDITDNHFGGAVPGGDRIGVGELKLIGTQIPEPSQLLLCGGGLAALALRRRRA